MHESIPRNTFHRRLLTTFALLLAVASVASAQRIKNPRELEREAILQQALSALRDPGGVPGEAAGNLVGVEEVEPNNTPGTAQSLGTVAAGTVVRGALLAADFDYYSFSAPAGSRVFAYVDTGGGQTAPTNDRDSFLTVFAPDGTTILEEDDDDGTGNGTDSVTESGFASTIAGRPLAAAGTYFVSVEGFGATSVAAPYRLFLIVTSGASAESEPNDTPATANPISLGTAVSGSIGVAGEVDNFSFTGTAGTVVFFAADGNPERDATNTDLILQLIHPDGRLLMSPAVDSGLGGSASNPEGEAFAFALPTSGTYTLVVDGFGTSAGTYQFVTADVAFFNCEATEVEGILGLGSDDYPTSSGTQSGRLNRFTDQTGTCGLTRSCPGAFTLAGTRPYDEYPLVNDTDATQCITVIVDAQQCLGNNFLTVAAYTGAYDSSDFCLNYLADIGGSPNPIGVFAFELPAGESGSVVVSAANASPTVCTTPYRLTIVNGCFVPAVIQEIPTLDRAGVAALAILLAASAAWLFVRRRRA